MILDLVKEAVAVLAARPQRAALTAVGTVLGTATLVATLGLAATASSSVVSRFDELAATSVTVTPVPVDSAQEAASAIPWDAGPRLSRLNGVIAAGTLSELPVSDVRVRAVVVRDPLNRSDEQLPIFAASTGAFPAVRGELAGGRWFDAGHSGRGDPVAVLGLTAARRLNVTDVGRRPMIFLGDRAVAVVGLLGAAPGAPDLHDAVIVSDGLAERWFGLGAPLSVRVRTAVGAAALIMKQAPTALAPHDPSLLAATRPPEPAETRGRIADDLGALLLVLAGICLVIGAVGIANTTLVSVLERIGEIGLRRSLGASRTHICFQFLLESSVVGLFGGVVGSSLGVLATVGMSAQQRWTPVLDPWLPPAAALAGAVVGLTAGLYPALRAARVEPIAALRAS